MENRSNAVDEYLEDKRQEDFHQECQHMDFSIFFCKGYDTILEYENAGKSEGETRVGFD